MVYMTVFQSDDDELLQRAFDRFVVSQGRPDLVIETNFEEVNLVTKNDFPLWKAPLWKDSLHNRWWAIFPQPEGDQSIVPTHGSIVDIMYRRNEGVACGKLTQLVNDLASYADWAIIPWGVTWDMALRAQLFISRSESQWQCFMKCLHRERGMFSTNIHEEVNAVLIQEERTGLFVWERLLSSDQKALVAMTPISDETLFPADTAWGELARASLTPLDCSFTFDGDDICLYVVDLKENFLKCTEALEGKQGFVFPMGTPGHICRRVCEIAEEISNSEHGTDFYLPAVQKEILSLVDWFYMPNVLYETLGESLLFSRRVEKLLTEMDSSFPICLSFT